MFPPEGAGAAWARPKIGAWSPSICGMPTMGNRSRLVRLGPEGRAPPNVGAPKVCRARPSGPGPTGGVVPGRKKGAGPTAGRSIGSGGDAGWTGSDRGLGSRQLPIPHPRLRPDGGDEDQARPEDRQRSRNPAETRHGRKSPGSRHRFGWNPTHRAGERPGGRIRASSTVMFGESGRFAEMISLLSSRPVYRDRGAQVSLQERSRRRDGRLDGCTLEKKFPARVGSAGETGMGRAEGRGISPRSPPGAPMPGQMALTHASDSRGPPGDARALPYPSDAGVGDVLLLHAGEGQGPRTVPDSPSMERFHVEEESIRWPVRGSRWPSSHQAAGSEGGPPRRLRVAGSPHHAGGHRHASRPARRPDGLRRRPEQHDHRQPQRGREHPGQRRGRGRSRAARPPSPTPA